MVQAIRVGPVVAVRPGPAVVAVDELVRDAVDRGATVLTGTGRPEGEGYFYSPTVLTGVPAEARMSSEEIFGPVAPLTAFSHRGRRSPPPTTRLTGWSPTS